MINEHGMFVDEFGIPYEIELGGEEEYEETKIDYIAILDAPRELPEPEDLTFEHLKKITDQLGLIKLCWPDIKSPKFEERVNFPDSYLQNSQKERLLLFYAENLRRQFCFKYPRRRVLYLASENECGMQKMVCTSIRPTTLPYPEIETWENCAKFVGNHLRYEPLDTPTEIPNRLYSPNTVFIRQSAQPQETATALCSLLLGMGYDAYVVFGYATRDVTLRIMTRVESPYPIEVEKPPESDEGEVKKKYEMTPPRDLRSKFLLMMEQREVDKVQAEKDRIAELERQRIEETEKPPYDELAEWRVHFWVLIKAGKKDVNNDIFIEPTTGLSHPLNTLYYTRIESVWNHINYWVNMQGCGAGLGNLDYNFMNVEKWEHLLPGEPIQWRKAEMTLDMEEEEIAIAEIMEEKHLDMPTSWTLRIYVPHHLLAQKFPDGVMKTWYKHTYVEEYAPYVQLDGLVAKVTRFDDFECTKVTSVEELFENRADNLIKTQWNMKDNLYTEFFRRGREDAVSKHTYYSTGKTKPDAARTIEFYHDARYDGLAKIEMSQRSMSVSYMNRDDFLSYRHVNYAERGKPPPGVVEGHRRVILSFIEKFLRNKEIPASENVASQEFALIQREIHLKYHFGEGKVTASTRTFVKPPVSEMGEDMRFNPDLTYGYEAEIGMKPRRQLELYLLLEKLLKEEEESLGKIREIEDQITEFLELRYNEAANPKLEVSLFNREQNEEHRLAMLEREKEMKVYKEKEVEEEIEYLAPYLTKLGIEGDPNYTEAVAVRDECLKDFKQLLLDRAIMIQKAFEKWTKFLTDRQQWYIKNQDTIKEKEELDYFDEINDLNFLLQCYDIRLARHRDLSAVRYRALVEYIYHHPRMKALHHVHHTSKQK